MLPTDLIRIDDDSFLAGVLKRRKRSLTETVPADIEPREALANIKECVSSLNKLGNATSVVGAILGAHMALMAKREDILSASGYDTMREFEKAEINDKLSHGSAYNWKRISEAFPAASIDQLLKAGSTNLLRGARALPPDASPAQREEFVEKAVEKNTAEYVVWVEETSGLSEKGGTSTDSFLLIGSKADIVRLKEDLADPHIEEVAGVETPLGKILSALALMRVEEVHSGDSEIQTGAPEGWT